MWRRLRPWLEVALAQLLVLVVTLPLGREIAGLVALVADLFGFVPHDPKGFGAAAFLILIALPLGILLAWIACWLLAWRFWFRKRLALRRFLLAWAVSLPIVALAPEVWSAMLRYLPSGGGGPRVERVEGPPLVFWRAAPDGPAFALAPGPGSYRLDGMPVETRCETLADGQVCFLLLPEGSPAPSMRIEVRRTVSEPVWLKPGWLRDVAERIEERPVAVRDAPPPRIAALAWKVAEGRLVVRVESEAPLMVDALCFRFDGDLVVRTGAGGDALRPGLYRPFADREMICVDPDLGYAGPLPALVQGARDFALPTLGGPDDPEDNARVVRQIRERGLAGGRTGVRTEVRLLGRFPGRFAYEPVRVDALFDLQPELDRASG